MKITVRVEVTTDYGESATFEICDIDRPYCELDPPKIGLSLAEGKDVLHELQKIVVAMQAEEVCMLRRSCTRCHRFLDLKDRRIRKVDTVFDRSVLVTARDRPIIDADDPRSWFALALRYSAQFPQQGLGTGVQAQGVGKPGRRLTTEDVAQRVQSPSLRSRTTLIPTGQGVDVLGKRSSWRSYTEETHAVAPRNGDIASESLTTFLRSTVPGSSPPEYGSSLRLDVCRFEELRH